MSKTGAEIRQSVFYWSFPSAEMHLIGLSSNAEFATASLVAKKAATPRAADGDEDAPPETDKPSESGRQ